MLILPLGPEPEDVDEPEATGLPWMTLGLLAVCLVVFTVGFGVTTAAAYLERILRFGFRSDAPTPMTYLSYQFVHADLGHLLGNGLFLWAFGVVVERRLGPAAVLVVYILSGLAGAMLHAGMTPAAFRMVGEKQIAIPLVGASGSIMGLVGCMLPSAPWVRIKVLVGFQGWWKVLPVQGWLVALGFLAKEVLYAVVFSQGSGVAYWCHVGGLSAGVLTGFALVAIQAGGLLRGPPGPIAAKAPIQGPVAARVPSGPLAGSGPAAPPRARPASPISASGAIARPPEALAAEVGPDVEASEREVIEAEESVDFAAVEPAQGLGNVSRSWAGSIALAGLQDRFKLARAQERDAAKAKAVFHFYLKVLEQKDLPPGYRVYAGARAARMLLRAGQAEKSLRLAERLLGNRLPDDTRTHLSQTAEAARRTLASRRPGRA